MGALFHVAVRNPKHRMTCKLLFAAILLAVLALIAVLVVQTKRGVEPTQRGGAGELTRPAQGMDSQALPAPNRP